MTDKINTSIAVIEKTTPQFITETMRGMKSIIIAAALAILPISAYAQSHTVHIDLGGDVGVRGNKINRMILTGERVEIRGVCASACTMLLAVGCVYPGARLGFHAPTIHRGPYTVEWWSQAIANYYPQRMADWYLAGPAHNSTMTWITGVDAVNLGAQQCQ